MKISVVTAVYNRSDTVADAIKSFRSQTYKESEHVIIDGASTDGTLEILQRLCDDRTLLRSEPDSGIYEAINKGIALATGEVVGLLHSDDIFASSEVLECVSQALNESPKAMAVYSDLDYVATSDPGRIIRHWKANKFHPSLLARGWMPPHPTLFVRREVFERWGVYDTSYRIAADYDAILRWFSMVDLHPIYLPKVLVKMRFGGASNRSLGHIMRKSAEDYRAVRANRVGGIGTLAMKNLSKLRQFFDVGGT